MVSNRILNSIYIALLICGIAVITWMIVSRHFVQWLDISTGVVFLADMFLIRYILPKDMDGRMGTYIVRLIIDLAMIAVPVYLLMTYGNI